jgi:glycosyltransferase involved in cell wall biosynthesis
MLDARASHHSSPSITALILARDEELELPECLASLGWADEVVIVVDAASSDATLDIARKRADRVLVRPFDHFAAQRNAGLELARGDWIFSIDADERATPSLAEEIRRLIPLTGYAGFRVPIRSIILGRPFRFSGTQRDLPTRLFRRNAGRWIGTVHETVDLQGSLGTLRGHLLHRSLNTMTEFLAKIDHYTTLEARAMHAQGVPSRARDLALGPLWTFLKLFLARQGFRDGLEGLYFCALSAASLAARNWKVRELSQSRKPAPAAPKPKHVSIPEPHLLRERHPA